MGTSVFSFLMSLIWCSVFLLLSVAWHKTMMLKHGTGFALIVILVGIVRLVLPLDLPLSIVVRSSSIMPAVQRFFDVTAFTAFGLQVDRFHVLIGIWMLGSTIYLICILSDVLKCKRFLKHMQKYQNAQANRIMSEIVSVSKPGKKYQIWVSDEIKTPMLAGYFTPVVLLPRLHLPDEELRYVLLHEWSHYLHKHLWVKLLFNIFCAILWWNPLAFIAKSDLNYILEVNCDQYVVQSFDESKRSEYVEAMVNTMKQLTDLVARRSNSTVGFIGMVSGKTVQRCELILYPIRKMKKRTKGAIYFGICLLAILSYSFIFQTAFMPPEIEPNGFVTISPENSYLKQEDTEEFDLYVNGVFTDRISPDIAKLYPYSNLPIYK